LEEIMRKTVSTIKADAPAGGTRRRGQRKTEPDRRTSGSAAGSRRARGNRAQSVERSALPGWLPRAAKREAGNERQVPAYIRSIGVPLTPDERAYMRRKLGMKLGKFARPIERVSVRLDDVNGPRGGVDKLCRVKVVLSGLSTVYVEGQAQTAGRAFDAALADAERTVRKALQRRRTRSLSRAG
jgi:ribosome-associated translation inhibitor RaiA